MWKGWDNIRDRGVAEVIEKRVKGGRDGGDGECGLGNGARAWDSGVISDRVRVKRVDMEEMMIGAIASNAM